MSETAKSNVQLDEQSIATSPEQAVNAATPEQVTEQTTQETAVETPVTESTRPATRQEIMERIKAIAAEGDILNCKAEVEGLKVQFYRLRTAEIDAARKEFVAEGGEENVFIPEPDALEEPFKEAMNIIKAKRNAWIKPGPPAGQT